jgi:hypothetical protein
LISFIERQAVSSPKIFGDERRSDSGGRSAQSKPPKWSTETIMTISIID